VPVWQLMDISVTLELPPEAMLLSRFMFTGGSPGHTID